MHASLRFAAVALLLALVEGCGGSLAQPFDQMKGQPMTIYRLQNFEPPPQPTAQAPAQLALPPQIQQWLTAGAQLLPPGLIPPGLIPGAAPPPPPPAQEQRFHGFRILGWMAINDDSQKDEVLDVFGHESSFTDKHGGCMYAEFGFAIGQKNGPPGDVLVSLSCDQVQPFAFAWPYGKTGITGDTAKRLIAVAQKAFGG
jgi:hypothetical protein